MQTEGAGALPTERGPSGHVVTTAVQGGTDSAVRSVIICVVERMICGRMRMKGFVEIEKKKSKSTGRE